MVYFQLNDLVGHSNIRLHSVYSIGELVITILSQQNSQVDVEQLCSKHKQDLTLSARSDF